MVKVTTLISDESFTCNFSKNLNPHHLELLRVTDLSRNISISLSMRVEHVYKKIYTGLIALRVLAQRDISDKDIYLINNPHRLKTGINDNIYPIKKDVIVVIANTIKYPNFGELEISKLAYDL